MHRAALFHNRQMDVPGAFGQQVDSQHNIGARIKERFSFFWTSSIPYRTAWRSCGRNTGAA